MVIRTATDNLGREVLAGTHTKEWNVAARSITSQKDAKGNSNTFHMIEGPAATVEAYKAAISKPDTHVVFVGHSLRPEGATHETGIQLSNGESYGKEGSWSTKVTPGQTPDSPPSVTFPSTVGMGDTVSASSVALFGCNTYDLTQQYVSTNFTGVQSGKDGVTMTDTLDLMAASWVSAGGGQPGNNASNAAVDNSPHRVDTGSNVESDPAQ
jgi:hypothetical protein